MSGNEPPDPDDDKPDEEQKEKPKSNESCDTERIGQEAKFTISYTANEG